MKSQCAWSKSQECVVEIISRGHYPDTVVVKLPNESTTEVYASDLTNSEQQRFEQAQEKRI